jgi:hypothetical protein
MEPTEPSEIERPRSVAQIIGEALDLYQRFPLLFLLPSRRSRSRCSASTCARATAPRRRTAPREHPHVRDLD